MNVISGLEGLLAEGGANWKRLEKGEVGAEGRDKGRSSQEAHRKHSKRERK